MFQFPLSTLFFDFLPDGKPVKTLMLWFDRSRQRRHLAGLDDRLLRDIGIERIDALNEARKPFWEA